LLGCPDQAELNQRVTLHLWERQEIRTKFEPHNLKEADNFEYLGSPRNTVLINMLEKYGVKMWVGFIWLKTTSSGGLLKT
jgi:hypothetical protein